MSTELQIEPDASGIGQIRDLAARINLSLSALEEILDFPSDSFLSLGDSICHELSVEPLSPAAFAGDDRITLSVGRNLELFAAALGALELYLSHVGPPGLR